MDNNSEEYQEEVRQLQDEIIRLLHDAMRMQTRNNTENREPNSIDRTILLREIINGYNMRMSEYQENIRDVISLLRPQQNRYTYDNVSPIRNRQRSRRNTEQEPPSQPDTSNLLFSYYVYPPRTNDNTRNLNTFFESLYQNVVVRPSQEQINNATQLIEYSETTNTNTNCPITLENFQTGDVIQQIKYCRHSFRPTAIQNWFTSNVKCPVCRYDIRNYIASDLSNNI